MKQETLDGFKKACGVYFLPLNKGGLDKKELVALAQTLRSSGHLRLQRGQDLQTLNRRELCSVLKPAVKRYTKAGGAVGVEGTVEDTVEAGAAVGPVGAKIKKPSKPQQDNYTKRVKVSGEVQEWLGQSSLDEIAQYRSKTTGGQTCQLGYVGESEVLIAAATPSDIRECEKTLRRRIGDIKKWNRKRPYTRDDMDSIVKGLVLDKPFLLPEPHMQRHASSFGYVEETPFQKQTANNDVCFSLSTLKPYEDGQGATTDPYFRLRSFIEDGGKGEFPEMLTNPGVEELESNQLYVYVVTNEMVRGKNALTDEGSQRFKNELRLLPVNNGLEFGSKHWNLVSRQAPVAVAGEMIREGDDIFWNLKSGSFTRYLMRLFHKNDPNRPLHGKIKSILSKGGNPNLAVWYIDSTYPTQQDVGRMLTFDLKHHYWQAETQRFLETFPKWRGNEKLQITYAPSLLREITADLPLSKHNLRELCDSETFRNRLVFYPDAESCQDETRSRQVQPLCDVLERQGYFKDPRGEGLCPEEEQGFRLVAEDMRLNWNRFKDSDNMDLKTLVNRKTLSDVRDLLQSVHWLWHPLGEDGAAAADGEKLIKYDSRFGVGDVPRAVETRDPVKYLLGAFSAMYSQLASLADITRKASPEYRETLDNFNTVFGQISQMMDTNPMTLDELAGSGKGNGNYKLEGNKVIPGAKNLTWDAYLRESIATNASEIYEGYRSIKNYWPNGRSAYKHLGFWGNVKKLLRGQIDRGIYKWEGREDSENGIKDIQKGEIMIPITTPTGKVLYKNAERFHDYRVMLRTIRKTLKFLWPVIPALTYTIPDEFLKDSNKNTGMKFGEAVVDDTEKSIARKILDDNAAASKRLFEGIPLADQDTIKALALLRLWTSKEPPCDDSCGLETKEGCEAMRRHCDLIYHMGLIHDHMVKVYEQGAMEDEDDENDEKIAELVSYIEDEFEQFMQRTKDLNLLGILHIVRQALCT